MSDDHRRDDRSESIAPIDSELRQGLASAVATVFFVACGGLASEEQSVDYIIGGNVGGSP